MVEGVTAHFQLGSRTDCVTTDNGSNFVSAIEDLVERGVTEEDARCVCHTFNLLVRSALDGDVESDV